MSSGIYSITNIKNGNKYVGSSGNIESRLSYHRSRLLSNKHPNSHLQSAWNKYGPSVFLFDVIEETDDRFEAEQSWIDNMLAQGVGLYNKAACVSAAMQGRKHTVESRLKMSKARENKPLTREHKQAIKKSWEKRRQTPQRKHTTEEREKIRASVSRYWATKRQMI